MRISGCLASLAILVAVPLTPSAAVPAVVPTVDRAGPTVRVDDDALIGREVIGYSVRGRPIVAWHLGRPGKPTALLVSTMHGNERDTRLIMYALKQGPPIHELDLWIIPNYNPDGYAAGTRRNAHGVDLNRNFPYRWVDLDGSYESGPAPASEPETKAVMAFLDRIRPRRIVSFHQPLYGVDRNPKRPGFSSKLSRYLRLPLKDFVCSGVCHGTMTGWFNHRYAGTAVTVEYDENPSHHRMTEAAPWQIIRALDGWRG